MTIVPIIYRFNTSHITKETFHRIKIKKITTCMETQKPLNTQSTFEKKKM